MEFLLVNKSRISQWEGGGRKPQTRGRGARRYLFSHAAVFIATATIPFLTSLPSLCSSVGLFCRPFVNRQNRFRPRLNEWRPTKSKVLEIFSRSRRSCSLLCGPDWERKGRKGNPENACFTHVPSLSSFSAHGERPRVGRTDKVASFSPFWR